MDKNGNMFCCTWAASGKLIDEQDQDWFDAASEYLRTFLSDIGDPYGETFIC